jgi:hypothetical protein
MKEVPIAWVTAMLSRKGVPAFKCAQAYQCVGAWVTDQSLLIFE